MSALSEAEAWMEQVSEGTHDVENFNIDAIDHVQALLRHVRDLGASHRAEIRDLEIEARESERELRNEHAEEMREAGRDLAAMEREVGRAEQAAQEARGGW